MTCPMKELDGDLSSHDRMRSTPQLAKVPLFSAPRESTEGAICLATYVERKFIPDHVVHKTGAGQIHYQAMLKHVLKPEGVERMFAQYNRASHSRLKAVPNWPYLDNVRLCDLTADHVRAITSSASAHGYSPQTIKHIKNVLGTVISHARDEGVLSGSNPTREVKLPPVVHRKVRSLTIHDAKEALRLMKHPEREIALLSITTGMSISEICALSWKDINLTDDNVYSDGDLIPACHILVKHQWSDREIVQLPPGRLRKLEVPEPILLRLRRSWRKHGRPNDGFAITLDGGSPLDPGDIEIRLERIGQRHGMPWLSWPVLRRAHHTLFSDLRIELSRELILRLL